MEYKFLKLLKQKFRCHVQRSLMYRKNGQTDKQNAFHYTRCKILFFKFFGFLMKSKKNNFGPISMINFAKAGLRT